jgi:hypothetical protein
MIDAKMLLDLYKLITEILKQRQKETPPNIPQPPPDEKPADRKDTPDLVPTRPPQWDTVGAREVDLTDGGGGMVFNPENSRNQGKIIFHTKYAGRISRVICLPTKEHMRRVSPNEYGDRQRYYTDTKIDRLPKVIQIVADLENPPERIYVNVPDSQVRWD